MCKSLQSLLSSHFHWETIGIQQYLEGYDKKPPKCVGGDKGLTKSVNISVNLANPAIMIVMMMVWGLVYGLRKTSNSVQMFFHHAKNCGERQ